MSAKFPGVLVEVLLAPGFSGYDLVQALKQSPYLAECFAAPLGGRDGLALEDHTLATLQTFERSFERSQLNLLSAADFKFLLAVHDLGKPQAVAEGHPGRQHAYTLRTIDAVLGGLVWSRSGASRIRELIGGDPIGACLNQKHLLPASDAAEAIRAAAVRLGVSVREYWLGLLVYYQCDAAGYPSVREKVFNVDAAGSPQFENSGDHFIFRDLHEAARFEDLKARVLANPC